MIILIVTIVFFQNKNNNQKQTEAPTEQNTLKDDINKGSTWISSALNSSGYKADYSIESLKEIDRFFDEHVENGEPKKGGLLSESLNSRMFSLGAYVGETLINNYGGKWSYDENDPTDEFKVQVILSDGAIIWPMQRVMKRLKNGKEDSIYGYGVSLKP